jgi:hypothetical protein
MKTISGIIISMALASIIGCLLLWSFGVDKTIVYIVGGYGSALVCIHVLMQDRIESQELELRNRNLYK